jgi:hypothetical protein
VVEQDLMLPELVVITGAAPSPLVMQYTMPPLDLGCGVNPINGQVMSGTLLTDPPAIPPPPAGVGEVDDKQTFTHFHLISTSIDFAQNVVADANASGYTGVVNGTLSASYLNSLTISAFNLTVVAKGLAKQGTFFPTISTSGGPYTWELNTANATQVVAAIQQASSYDDFIASYGTHFIGGVIYGNQYFATLNSSYQNIGSQTSAQAAVSGAVNSGTEGGEFNASIQTTISQQTGYVNQEWDQLSVGGYDALTPATIDNINTNLQDFPKAPPDPILYMVYDWRILPGVMAAAGTLSFNWDAYVKTLRSVQDAVSQLNFILNTSQAALTNSVYIGATNQQYLAQTVKTVTTAITTLENYTPTQVAQFEVNQFLANYNFMPQLTAITNGMYNVQISYKADKNYHPPSQTQVFQVYEGGAWAGFTVPKTSPSEDWFFGCQFPNTPDQATAQPIQGLIVTGGGLDSTYSNFGTTLSYAAGNTTQTISGVDNGTYPWIKTTVTMV